jgi:hypothetical protein
MTHGALSQAPIFGLAWLIAVLQLGTPGPQQLWRLPCGVTLSLDLRGYWEDTILRVCTTSD